MAKLTIGDCIYLPAFEKVFQVDTLPFFPDIKGYHTVVFDNGVYESISTSSTSAKISADVCLIPKIGDLLVHKMRPVFYIVDRVHYDYITCTTSDDYDVKINFESLRYYKIVETR